MNSNPFQYLDPVAPAAFVARWPLVKRIALDLILEGGNSHAIIAGRRCGKSSVLLATAYQLRQPSTQAAGDWQALPIVFDFKSGEFSSAGNVFVRLMYEVVRRVDVNVRRRPPDAWPETVMLDAPWFIELVKSESITLQDFEDGIGYILEQLSALGHHARLEFLIDEIDDALDKPWTEGLFNQLRALVYSGDLRSQIRLVFAGSHRFLDQVSKRGSPLWNVLKLHYLDPFDERGFSELVERALELSKEVINTIWQQSGGHPFIAQYLLHHLWEESLGCANATPNKVNDLAGKFLSEQIQDVEGWALGVDLAGFHAYSVLASPADWIEERDILRAINNPDLNIKRGLLALCYHGLALHDDGWSHYRRAGDLFRTWFVNYGPTFLASRKVPDAVISQIGQMTAQTIIISTNTQVQQEQLSVGNISNSIGVAIGPKAQASVTQIDASTNEVAKAFVPIYAKVNALPDGQDKDVAQSAVKALEAEASKGEQADEKSVTKWFSFLAETAADAWDVAVNTFVNPILGVGKVFQLIAAKAKQEKAKKESAK